jgi:hypothetical protein
MRNFVKGPPKSLFGIERWKNYSYAQIVQHDPKTPSQKGKKHNYRGSVVSQRRSIVRPQLIETE